MCLTLSFVLDVRSLSFCIPFWFTLMAILHSLHRFSVCALLVRRNVEHLFGRIRLGPVTSAKGRIRPIDVSYSRSDSHRHHGMIMDVYALIVGRHPG